MSALRSPRPFRTALGLIAAVSIAGLLAACAGDTTSADPASAGPTGSGPSVAVPNLAGTSWNLATYADPAGAQSSAVADAVAPLTFAADGTVAGSTGCNRFIGTFTQDGSDVTILLGPVTLIGCSGPVADQESAVLAALPKVTSAATTGSDLALADTDGAVLLVYSPGTASVIGTSWVATGINNGKDALVTDDQTSAATAQFGDDGTVTGSGGCNTFNAEYTLEGTDGIKIGPITSTKKACPEPASATEQQYFAALEASTTYVLEGDTLTLRDAAGAAQVALRAAS